jgi:hypothetical protein
MKDKPILNLCSITGLCMILVACGGSGSGGGGTKSSAISSLNATSISSSSLSTSAISASSDSSATEMSSSHSSISVTSSSKSSANALGRVDAGTDKLVIAGDQVTLSANTTGAAPFTYKWSQLSGPTIELTGATTASASFLRLLLLHRLMPCLRLRRLTKMVWIIRTLCIFQLRVTIQ